MQRLWNVDTTYGGHLIERMVTTWLQCVTTNASFLYLPVQHAVRFASRACFKNKPVLTKGAKKPSLRKLMIASQLRGVFENSKVVALFHYNDLSVQKWTNLRLDLAKSNLRIKIFPSKVSAKALEGTVYRNIVPLFRGCTAVAYGRDESTVTDLLSCTAKEANLHLLGGIVDNQMFNPRGLQEYADLPSAETLYQQLLGILTQPQMMLRSHLQATPQRLSQMLGQVAQGETGSE